MKITREQKEKNRTALLEAGVDLMSEEGLKEVTLRRIALRAGLSEPVIYNYFPSKDHLLAAYFIDTFKKALVRAEAQTDFAELGFSEQIHLLMDALLAEYEKHRDFVSEAFQNLFLSGLSGSLAYLAEEKNLFVEMTKHWLDGAVEAKEFPLPPSSTVIVELIWDFHLGLIFYWLKDTSDGSMRTLQLLDRSLGILGDLLKSNMFGRMTDLLYFFAREHFMKSIDKLTELTHDQKVIKTRFFQNNGKKTKGRRTT